LGLSRALQQVRQLGVVLHTIRFHLIFQKSLDTRLCSSFVKREKVPVLGILMQATGDKSRFLGHCFRNLLKRSSPLSNPIRLDVQFDVEHQVIAGHDYSKNLTDIELRTAP
jgi:hypothetical protein